MWRWVPLVVVLLWLSQDSLNHFYQSHRKLFDNVWFNVAAVGVLSLIMGLNLSAILGRPYTLALVVLTNVVLDTLLLTTKKLK